MEALVFGVWLAQTSEDVQTRSRKIQRGRLWKRKSGEMEITSSRRLEYNPGDMWTALISRQTRNMKRENVSALARWKVTGNLNGTRQKAMGYNYTSHVRLKIKVNQRVDWPALLVAESWELIQATFGRRRCQIRMDVRVACVFAWRWYNDTNSSNKTELNSFITFIFRVTDRWKRCK